MSKIKKVLAVFLTLAMVLGMGLTTFAAGTAEITIGNAEKATSFDFVQVIKDNPATITGWEFTSPEVENHYVTAFGQNDAQVIIKELIDRKEGYDSKSAVALENILKDTAIEKTTSTVNPISVSSAGVYAIMGTEKGYSYSPMAAYVGFKNYATEPSLEDTNISAKKTPEWIEKKSDDDDKVVEIGRKVTYTVNSTVPYIANSDENKFYIIQDTISGAKYNVEADGENVGKLKVNVKVGETTETRYVDLLNEGTSFKVDLSNYVKTDENRNKEVVITYEAIVTDVQVGNIVIAGDGNNEGDPKYGSDHEELYTGEITLTKTGENNKLLAKAEFVVYRTDKDGTISYATFDDDNKLSGWVGEQAQASKVVTGTDGTVKVQGLDVGTYKFKEVKAPEGYSINSTDSEATLVVTGEDGVASAIIKATSTMADTKLSSLPSTGGIGTTIFTIGGCLIMIIAAALFFASRRKNNK